MRDRRVEAVQEGDELADDAATEKEHRDHEDHALNDEHPLAEARELVLHGDDDAGPEDRSEHCSHAADERHQDHLARHLPGHVRQRRELEHERLERAREPRERGREHECDQLEGIHRIAERDGARLVLANGLHHLPERRMDRAVDDQEADREDRQNDVVEVDVAGRVDHAEQRPARNGLDAVLATGELRLHAEEEHHLRQGQRHHGEVDALPADGEKPRHEPHEGRARCAREDPEFGSPAHHLYRVARDVGGKAEEHGVPEREQADVADEQVEGQCEQREAQDLHQEDGIDEERRDEPEGHQRPEDEHIPVLGHGHCRFPTSECRTGLAAESSARSP